MRPLIIPAEQQVREFDAKLLLACVAAERGFPAVVGSRTHIHLAVTSLPAGIYFAKSFRAKSLRMFRIFHDLGHEVVACDEEALLPYPDELYFERRASPETLRRVSMLFAWGSESAALFRRCPGYTGAPIHTTGNARVDLMRPELRGYFREDVEQIRRRFGDFILINTNFSGVNHYVPKLGWMDALSIPDGCSKSEDTLRAMARQRLTLFGHFKELVPTLSRTFPELSIVVRPHPVESHDPWRAVASQCRNVHVLHEGNVIPWVLASRALVHNGCTTGIEASILGQPAVSYHPATSGCFDDNLPNRLGHRAFDAEEICSLLRRIVNREIGASATPEQRELLERHVTGLEGPLACDRTLDVLERAERAGGSPPPTEPWGYAKAWMHARLRRAVKGVKALSSNHINSARYQQHRFPGLSLDEVRERVARLGRQLGRFADLRIEQHSDQIFRIEGG